MIPIIAIVKKRKGEGKYVLRFYFVSVYNTVNYVAVVAYIHRMTQ